MTDGEREELRKSLHGDAGATAGQARPTATPRVAIIPFAQNSSKTRPLLISSGKGGVGKSSVTTNLAVALAQQGYSVGVVDADIYGYSIPRMLGADRDPTVIDEMIIPPEAWGVRCISIGYFVPEGQAVIWRGPMLHKALEQFLTDVFWDEPDFLLIDMPPGTGDIALSLVAVPAPRRGVRRHHTAAGGPEGRRAVGGDGGQGQPARAWRDREHVVVHRRRRQAVRDLRLRRRPTARRRPRRPVPRVAAAHRRTARGRRHRPADHRRRSRVGSGADVPRDRPADRRRHEAEEDLQRRPQGRCRTSSSASPRGSHDVRGRRRCCVRNHADGSGTPLPLRPHGERGARRLAARTRPRARQRRGAGARTQPRGADTARAVPGRAPHRPHAASRARTSSRSTGWRCATRATTSSSWPRRCSSR